MTNTTAPTVLTQVFISYSRRDSDFANRLEKALEAREVRTWIDREGIHAGSKWSETIQNALDDSALMIVIISPESMASENVRDEWQYFRDHGKPIIPVLLRPAKIHFQLNRIQYVDFASQRFETAMTQLQAELARHAENGPISAAAAPAAMRPPRPRRLIGFGAAAVGMLMLAFAVTLIVAGGGVSPGAATPTPDSSPEATSRRDANPLLATTAVFETNPQFTPDTSITVRVTTPFANLRSGPGMNYEEVATAVENDEFTATAQTRGFNTDGESIVWYYVNHPIGGSLWVSSEVVEVDGGTASGDPLIISPLPPTPLGNSGAE